MAYKTRYKLTDQKMQTMGSCQWVLGEWKETDGSGELCGPGWLHAYKHPLLAVLHNSIHAEIKEPRLFKVQVFGKEKRDGAMKCGFTKMRLAEEIALPEVTTIQRVAYGILCALDVCQDAEFQEWARKWLSGEDRSWAAARAAAIRATRDTRAAWSAWYAIEGAAAAWADTRVAAEAAAEVAAEAAARAVEEADRNIDLIKIAKKAMTYK